MNQIVKSTPVDREAHWNSKQILECKIDLEGIIVSVNEVLKKFQNMRTRN